METKANHSVLNRMNITRFTGLEYDLRSDVVIVEEPLQIDITFSDHGKRVRRNLAITMRTPGHDKELVKGFLFAENIISSWSDIDNMVAEENLVHVVLRDDYHFDPNSSLRNIYSNSSCGICGKTSVDQLCSDSIFLPWSEKWCIKVELLYKAYQNIHNMDSLFSITGGNHLALLLDQGGKMIKYFEDVGRHNAMDKLVGASDTLPLSRNIVLWSGRSSFELVQKAAKAGVPIVVAIGAPSSLAISLAEEHGMTLVGFLKGNSCNVYTHSERIVVD